MQTLSAKEVQELLNKRERFALLNVLDKEKFEEAHIPNSHNFPVKDQDFVERVRQQVADKTQKVVVYCANTECDASTKAARRLEEAGYENVYDFKGGIQEWREANYPVESSLGRAPSSSPGERSPQSPPTH